MSLAQCSKDELQISLILKTRITQFGAHLCTNPLWKQLQEKDENILIFSNPTNWSLLGKQVHFYYYYFYYYYYLFHRCYYFHCYYYHNYYHYHYISQQEPVVKTSKCTPATPTSPTGMRVSLFRVSLFKLFSHRYQGVIIKIIFTQVSAGWHFQFFSQGFHGANHYNTQL